MGFLGGRHSADAEPQIIKTAVPGVMPIPFGTNVDDGLVTLTAT